MQTSAARTRRMALCALFTALTAVCSQVALPTPWGVPVNLALFGVYMAGTMQGPWWGAASQGVYLALAAFGLPVMAGFQGGAAALFGRTGGYALGYALAAAVTGALSQKRRGFGALCAAMALITFVFDSVFVWCVCVPLAYVLTRFTSLPVTTLFFICQATEAVKCVIGFIMIRERKWMQTITV